MMCSVDCIPCQMGAAAADDDLAGDGPCGEYDEGGPGTIMDDGYPQCAGCGYMKTEHGS